MFQTNTCTGQIESRLTSTDGRQLLLFHTGWSPLSTFHYTPFDYNTQRYAHVEQFYQVQKAKHFGDADSAIEILRARSPRKCKELGNSIKGYVAAEWNAVAEKIMYSGALEKFMQNSVVRKYLKDTGDAVIGEATRFDNYWAIGLDLDDPGIGDIDAWPGQNIYGQILMKVRANLP